MSDEYWDLAFVLPNIRLPEGDTDDASTITAQLAAKHVALVPQSDPRIAEIRKQSPAAAKLLGRFHDQVCKRVLPSALIFERRAPDTVRLGALVAFRNAIALALALPSWGARGENAQFVYGDIFDFYPTTVSEDGSRLHTISPALRAVWSRDARFVGMPSPHLTHVTFKYGADTYLLTMLKRAWERRFVDGGGEDAFGRALFRSLELAYAALATPVKNQGSLYDWGISLSLWTSALEILAHPQASGELGTVRQSTVLDLIAAHSWFGDYMQLKTRTVWLGERLRGVNMTELACHRLYTARNHFLHGNPVSDADLAPFGDKAASLIQIAPSLYRVALRAFMQRRYRRYETDAPLEELSWDDWQPHSSAMVADAAFESQVARLFEDDEDEGEDAY